MADSTASPEKPTANGTGAAEAQDASPPARRAPTRETAMQSLGEAVLALATAPRYQDQSLGDLQRLVIAPLMRDRLSIARPTAAPGVEDAAAAPGGVAIWATVSAEVDANIRRQVKAGVFPTRLRAEDWTSGDIVWLLDVVAPGKAATEAVTRSFGQLARGRPVSIHPVVRASLGEEALGRIGRVPGKDAAPPSD